MKSAGTAGSLLFPLVPFLVLFLVAACSLPSRSPPSPRPRSEFVECPLSDRDTLDALIEKVRSCMIESTTGWLEGVGWSTDLFASVPLVYNPLDEVETTGPIALLSADGDAYWVNHGGLEIAGITSATPDPPGGRIGRFPGTFRPNGLLFGAAMDSIDRLMPPPRISRARPGRSP